jgi:YHS domain-containing protein
LEALIYFAIWAGFIFLMMRFGCGAHVMGHGRGGKTSLTDGKAGAGSELRWIAPEKDLDPVCGESLHTDKAKPSVHDGAVYYFCSRECREVFEAAPEQYLGGGNKGAKNREPEHSHV